MKWTQTISTEVTDGYRIVKSSPYADDVREADEVSPFGIDSNAPKDTLGVYEMSENQKPLLMGYVVKYKLGDVKPGETRLFSLKSDGTLSAYAWLKDDGNLYLQGEGDFAVRYNKLEEAYNQLKDDHDAVVSDINDLKQAFSSWAVVPNDGGAALKAIAATWFAAPLTDSTGDITPAKIDNIIVPES